MLTTIMLLLVVTQGIVCYVLYLERKRYLKDYKYIKKQSLSTIKEIYNLKHDIDELKKSLENIVYKTKAIDEWIDKQAWEKLKKDKPNLTFFPIES